MTNPREVKKHTQLFVMADAELTSITEKLVAAKAKELADEKRKAAPATGSSDEPPTKASKTTAKAKAKGKGA